MKKYLRVNEVAEQLKVSAHAVRNYANDGKIEYSLTPSNQRVFTQEQVDKFLGKTTTTTPVFYTRSNNGNKTLLKNQVNQLTQEYGEPLKVYTDTGSGLNENRKNLNRMIEDAQKGEFNTIYVTQKDCLTRFGYRYLETLFKTLGVTIVVQNETKQSAEEELLQDFMNLLASFSGKFYRLRGYEQQRRLLMKAGEQLGEETD